MRNKTKKRLERKWDNLPRYFVDSSVFLSLALKQEKYKGCLKFFNLVGLKYRLETSIIVLGEVVRRFDKIKDINSRDKLFKWLESILRDKKITIHIPSKACFSLGQEIISFDSYLGSVDALIFENCIEKRCPYFVTLDEDFSHNLGKEYSIKILGPIF